MACANCGNNCDDNCITECFTSSVTEKYQCSSCDGTCTDSCTSTCGGNCYTVCQSACQNNSTTQSSDIAGADKGCNANCVNGCANCNTECGMQCSGACKQLCDSCSGSCSSGCSGCAGSCSGRCTRGCSGSCDIGCQSEAQIEAYKKLKLEDIIEDKNMKDIKDFIKNEILRTKYNNSKDGSIALKLIQNKNFLELLHSKYDTDTKKIKEINISKLSELFDEEAIGYNIREPINIEKIDIVVNEIMYFIIELFLQIGDKNIESMSVGDYANKDKALKWVEMAKELYNIKIEHR